MSVVVRAGYIQQNLPDKYIKARVLENFIKERIDEFGSEWAWRVSMAWLDPNVANCLVQSLREHHTIWVKRLLTEVSIHMMRSWKDLPPLNQIRTKFERLKKPAIHSILQQTKSLRTEGVMDDGAVRVGRRGGIIPSSHRGVTGKGREHQADFDFSSLGDEIERWLWTSWCALGEEREESRKGGKGKNK